MNASTCKNCRFYAEHLKDEQDGIEQSECRRYPPTFAESVSSFPMVIEHDWCGEFQDRPTA